MPGWLRFRKTADTAPEKAGHGLPEAVELALLDGIRRGRRADFESLYRLYHPRLTRFLVHLLREAELVEEVLDDTLMVVWQRASAFDGRSKLSTWIFGIAYRKAMKALGRFDAPQVDDEAEQRADPGPGPEQQLGLAQLRERLQQALGELSVDHRAVVELCYFQDMSHGEIAAIVGCPPETVKTRMFYARRRLRGLLADLEN
ncbi:MAG: sigma-70 family RNA polymerase sigma factor [Paucibacter sp.]|nr:sigma-70 family RNA polymerase sigma factor [Roseateles sp.]